MAKFWTNNLAIWSHWSTPFSIFHYLDKSRLAWLGNKISLRGQKFLALFCFYLPSHFGSCPVWPDWAIFCNLGNPLKPVATIILPKSPTLLGNFCKGVKIILFLLKSFLGNYCRHSAIFIWSHCSCLWSTTCSDLVHVSVLDCAQILLGTLCCAIWT